MFIKKTWKYYLIPEIANVLFFPLLLVDKSGNIALVELITNAVVVPIYLTIISMAFWKSFEIRSFLMTLVIAIVVILLDGIISYMNWGIITKQFWTPDTETIHLLKVSYIVAIVISFSSMGIGGILKWKAK